MIVDVYRIGQGLAPRLPSRSGLNQRPAVAAAVVSSTGARRALLDQLDRCQAVRLHAVSFARVSDRPAVRSEEPPPELTTRILVDDELHTASLFVVSADGADADGAEVLTMEGLSTVEGLHPLQAAFGSRGAVLDGTPSTGSAGLQRAAGAGQPSVPPARPAPGWLVVKAR